MAAMVFCPRCGTQNPPAQPACSACGSALQSGASAAPAPGAKSAKLMHTMLGVGAGPAPAAPAADPHKTLLGVGGEAPTKAVSPTWPDAPPAQTPQPDATAPTWPGQAEGPPAAAGGIAAHKTMLGVGAVTPAATGAAPQPAAAQPQAQGGLQRTMLGIAPQQPNQAPQAAPPAPAAAPESLPIASAQKTMLGIAHPGIAPLHPTAEKPAPAAPAWNAAAAPPATAAAPTPEDLSVLPGHKPRRVSLVAVLAIVGFVALLAGVVVVAVLWKSSGPLSAKVTLDQQNHEQLELGCPGCPDGTRATLGKGTATFKAGHAVLPVARPLHMGDNDLEIALTRPGESHSSTIALTVPVDYRVRGDLSLLSEEPPKLRVTVTAQKGSSVTVDGKPVALAADGTAHYDVDVTHDLTGAASNVQPLERKVAYSVKPPHAKAPDSGEVKFQLGIVPLVIDAPGPRIVTDAQTFMLAGHTAKGGAVSVGGRPIKVDAQGSFAQLMNVSAVGETTINVRATAKDRAPRLFPLHVKRVKSLRDEAAKFQKNAIKSYADISGAIDSKKGKAVALAGKVVEARTDHHRSYVLFDVSGGCRHGPCLARLVYGESGHFERNDKLTAFGQVTRGVDGPRRGSTIPEIAVDFFLKGAAR